MAMKPLTGQLFSIWQDFIRGNHNDHQSPDRASFEKSYRQSLEHVERDRESIAYELARDWERDKAGWRESDILEILEKQGFKKHGCVRHEMARRQRAERLIEMGKAHTPERSVQENGLDLDRD